MSISTYGKAVSLWRDAAGADWTEYTHHAFVEGLGDGSLPRESFLHYLVQDYVYLVHYARAWALGVVKSETPEEMRICASTVDTLVNHESMLHVEVCAAAGIDEKALFSAPESRANLAYTRYVLDAGFSGDLCDLLAALAPCAIGYGEIGSRLAQQSAAGTPYKAWIATYAGEPFQQACQDVGTVIDAALERRLGRDFTASPRWPRLCERFSMATRLESDFWQMGLDRS